MQYKTKITLAIIAAVIILIPVLIIAAVAAMVKSEKDVGYGLPNFALTTSSGEREMIGAQESTLAPAADTSAIYFEEITAGSTAAEVDQKIIKTGYLEIVVDSADEAATKITALATGLGGYTQDTSISEDESGVKYGTVTVRLPTEVFERAMTEIKEIAVSVATESSNAQDVTEEYTDLEARLSNAEAQEDEYLVILKKATSVTDILAVQSYLGQVRQEIETLKGRIQYLENMTSYSTITTYLSEDPTIKIPSKEFRPWTAVKEAAQAVVSVLQGLVITLIWVVVMGAGILAPIALLVWLVVIIVKKVRRRHQR